VERLGGYGRLEDYMSKNIWVPLGITAATFRLDDRPDVNSNLVDLLARNQSGGLEATDFFLKPNTFKYDSGGAGLYIKPSDYAKLLTSLLRNDEVVLKKETVDLMFTPQLANPKWLRAGLKATPYPIHYTVLHAIPQESEWNWGLGGILIMEDVPGKRKKGTLAWSGLPNLFWVSTDAKSFCVYSSANVFRP
jgi:CubicO group peptidase (beta-lactamase class C family)